MGWWRSSWCNAPAATSGPPAICSCRRPRRSFRSEPQPLRCAPGRAPVRLVLHDSRRLSDGGDPEHGPRAAELARILRGRAFQLSTPQFKQLHAACAGHTGGRNHPDLTVRTCWDADRLDLGRIGIRPSPRPTSPGGTTRSGRPWRSADGSRSSSAGSGVSLWSPDDRLRCRRIVGPAIGDAAAGHRLTSACRPDPITSDEDVDQTTVARLPAAGGADAGDATPTERAHRMISRTSWPFRRASVEIRLWAVPILTGRRVNFSPHRRHRPPSARPAARDSGSCRRDSPGRQTRIARRSPPVAGL
jgi:hypothetical protein